MDDPRRVKNNAEGYVRLSVSLRAHDENERQKKSAPMKETGLYAILFQAPSSRSSYTH